MVRNGKDFGTGMYQTRRRSRRRGLGGIYRSEGFRRGVSLFLVFALTMPNFLWGGGIFRCMGLGGPSN